jgi:hypothetical protein
MNDRGHGIIDRNQREIIRVLAREVVDLQVAREGFLDFRRGNMIGGGRPRPFVRRFRDVRIHLGIGVGVETREWRVYLGWKEWGGMGCREER